MSAQIADKVGGEAMTIRGSTLLSVENTGDDRVRVMSCQTTEQRNGVFIGAHCCASTRQVEIDLGQSATPPTQREMSAMLFLVDRDDDFLKYGAQEFFLVSWQGGWSSPNGGQILM